MKQSFSPNASRHTLECSPSAPMTRRTPGTARAQTGPAARAGAFVAAHDRVAGQIPSSALGRLVQV